MNQLETEKILEMSLGFKPPVSVIKKAEKESEYLRSLLVSKTNPKWLALLFESAYSTDNNSTDSLSILKKFVVSTFDWSLSGLKTVDDTQFKKRWAICENCELLEYPPENLIYHLGKKIVSGTGDDRICGACGCFAKSKAKRSTENCPITVESNSNLSRWYEPIEQS